MTHFLTIIKKSFVTTIIIILFYYYYFRSYFPLPKLTPEGYRVNILSLSDPDPKKYYLITLLKRVMAMADVRRKSEIYFAGDIIIHDCKGFSFSHLTKITPSLARKFMFCLQVISIQVVILINRRYLIFNDNSKLTRPLPHKGIAYRPLSSVAFTRKIS